MTARVRSAAAVLISGGGSNLQAFIDAVAAGRLDLDLSVVISNRDDAGGLERARRAGIPARVIANRDFPDRAGFDSAIAAEITHHGAGLVILAGFMRILGPAFVAQFAGRLLNIHPSLLPAYPGLDTHARVLAAGERWHGCTVHFVTEELDGGPRIIQGRVPVRPHDDVDALARRVLAVEHRIYPRAAALWAAGRLALREGQCWLDGAPLEEPLAWQDGRPS
ncbi:MAG TPA: phosphoribosylglycinamide formyltransferase [Woeseiaceae bacterium]|nr:phosphoribosylglycinamide formyltransferase [Woeseiaceae bacterium]